MGVMSCSRNGCDSIMCDTYIDSVGYICRYCQDEFKSYLKALGKSPKTKGELHRELKITYK